MMPEPLLRPPILFFTPDPPAALWQDKPQIARRLARRFPVVMVGPELHLRSLVQQWRLGHWRLSDCWRPALRSLGPDLYRFGWPPYTARTGAPLLGQLTSALRRRCWQAVLHHLNDQRPILWLFRPGMLHLIELFQPRLVIYHVVDEYSAYPGLSPAQATRQRELDAQLTRRANLVFCTARSLVEAHKALNPNTHYLPNAVDYAAFQQALASQPPPSALQALSFPRLGFVGGINAKLDLDLLLALAKQHPRWTVVLVGPLGYGLEAASWKRLQALPNVHWLGPVPPDQVPAVLAAFDVCLIPYRLNQQTRHINPLKVYEYLATGKPIVATPLPELAQFGSLVHLAGDPSAFARAVQTALAEAADPDAAARRQAAAAANTWDHRVERMVALIDAALATG